MALCDVQADSNRCFVFFIEFAGLLESSSWSRGGELGQGWGQSARPHGCWSAHCVSAHRRPLLRSEELRSEDLLVGVLTGCRACTGHNLLPNCCEVGCEGGVG